VEESRSMTAVDCRLLVIRGRVRNRLVPILLFADLDCTKSSIVTSKHITVLVKNNRTVAWCNDARYFTGDELYKRPDLQNYSTDTNDLLSIGRVLLSERLVSFQFCVMTTLASSVYRLSGD
jgi:hypothetical protein